MGKTSTQKAPTFYATRDINEGNYTLHLALTQTRRGALVHIVDEFDGTISGTVKLPTNRAGDFAILLDNLQAGKTLDSFHLDDDRIVEGVLALGSTERGPLLLITEKWGVGDRARAFTATIPAKIAAAVNAALQELAQEAAHLPELPPLPEPQPRQERRDRGPKPAPTGTGTWIGKQPPQRQDRKQEQKQSGGHPLLGILTVIADHLGRIADALAAQAAMPTPTPVDPELGKVQPLNLKASATPEVVAKVEAIAASTAEELGAPMPDTAPAAAEPVAA